MVSSAPKATTVAIAATARTRLNILRMCDSPLEIRLNVPEMPSGEWKRRIFRATAPTCWETQDADRPNSIPTISYGS